MTHRIAINGFGRIGRNIVRALVEEGYRHDLEVVAVNDLAPIDACAWLLKHDSAQGLFDAEVGVEGTNLVVDGKKIAFLSEKDPTKLPWKDLGVELVMECTGRFTTKETALMHVEAGAKKVLISAPGKGVDKTVVFGVNDDMLTAQDVVVSNASCTTNCLAPLAKVLNDKIGIDTGLVVTVHAVTNNQPIVDMLHKDLRRARSGMQNIIPTKTGAASAVGLVIPELAGKLDGYALRVPVINVSMVDFSVNFKRDTSVEEINAVLKEASETTLKGILGYSTGPYVSGDFMHDARSSIYDEPLTKLNGRHGKVCSWYDNEWGFSNRMLDTALKMLSVG